MGFLESDGVPFLSFNIARKPIPVQGPTPLPFTNFSFVFILKSMVGV
jgi:hypothetical protein